MKLNNLFVAGILLAASSSLYANCSDDDSFGEDGYLSQAEIINQEKIALLEEDNAGVPFEWISE